MPHYLALGEMPAKKHTLFSTSRGEECFEEFIGEEGFSSTGSLLYHTRVPSSLVDSRPWDLGATTTKENRPLLPHHYRLHDLVPDDDEPRDAVRDRVLVLGNSDVNIRYVSANTASPLYSNAVGDEVVFVESGSATLQTVFGEVEVRQGDNVVIPRVTIHRWVPGDDGPLRLYCVEAAGHINPPAKYLSRFGQFLEGSPLTERDLRTPTAILLAPEDQADDDTEVYVKHRGDDGVTGSVVVYDHHPFDVVGWDGQLYPYAFNYRDFAPVTGQLIQPPPTYQILEGDGFVVCNFVPRMLEYHPRAIKVPYYHSNVDSDEVMFYFAGETAAREGSGIRDGSVSLHPAGYTHGPGRKAYLESVNHTESKETAFMVDTFRPLRLADAVAGCEDTRYPWTWSGRGPLGGSPAEATAG
ncbi:homogentisate 1,2-dioxygenase [Actinoallomurus iriomotensis]|uniref:Homogentisate 1,2-dioxygenase n=1 Tax=Actinoallomurus iriomotensis TaxID=478107 RepID=A0A9W6S589_9ACTN|nr:homogentisate 1,2-dioxygenase [Actinoallomurus iriomotensis]GLY88871.1 putative homogentisate 1,2-dioxygenase [Actinoallomurus iriomotensis]